MKPLKSLLVVLILLGCSQHSNDYRGFVIGTWEGRVSGNGQDDRIIMYLTFSYGTLTVDYSPSGGRKFTAPYTIKDERTIMTSRYPDNLVIERLSGNAMKLRPEIGEPRKIIEMIYQCKFIRTAK